MKKKTVYLILILLFAALFLLATGKVINIISGYRHAEQIHLEEQSAFMDDSADARFPIQVDFDSLAQKNADIIGWIYSPDTPINYPVVQAEDNQKYLRRDLDGKYLVTGTIFADFRNRAVGEDRNFILYGHNMKDTSMFGTLLNYENQGYFDAHPTLYFATPSKNYRIELYCSGLVTDDAPIYQPNPSEAELTEFLSELKANTRFSSETTLLDTDRLITLSTCSYESNHARYLVIGKLVE